MGEVRLTTRHPVAQCVDLRATFAGVFRFAWDEAYAAERPEFRAIEAPWLTVIPCRRGHIYPYGGRLLAAGTRDNPRLEPQLERLPCVSWKHGRLVFDVADIETVAAVMGARRPRRVSEFERGRLRALSARHGFSGTDRQPSVNAGLATQEARSAARP